MKLLLGQRKNVFPIDHFYANNNNRSAKSISVSDFNNRRLTVAILTISDKRLIETDLLKTGFLFEFSSCPCTIHLIDVSAS